MAAIGTPVEQASNLRLNCSVKASWRTHRLRPALLLCFLQWKEFRRIKRGPYSGRRPSFSGANPQGVESAAQTPLTPSKLIKRKSLGFVRLGFGGGSAHATEERQQAGKYPGLGLGLGRCAESDDEEEDYGDQRQRTRRKSFLRMLLDHDKPKEREDHEMPTKQGSRGFMGSVRRISLVGKDKKAQASVGWWIHRTFFARSFGWGLLQSQQQWCRIFLVGKRTCTAPAALLPSAPPNFGKSVVIAPS